MHNYDIQMLWKPSVNPWLLQKVHSIDNDCGSNQNESQLVYKNQHKKNKLCQIQTRLSKSLLSGNIHRYQKHFGWLNHQSHVQFTAPPESVLILIHP